ncbi:hypothetical protein CYLTODRAFT_417375 [Cylindrobasidium torrendii FP15055 ss-10]|uniref:Uncharacterized protein n=1 Tax=Cylindrobasidium torrendii FP15055 ss-10 TaxID=1314674 RepID=A0A0D7BRE7_9AGAR|nr:hypothetical protein CYLTODRAFT_417375 [Cylindrobasidium torrendii FP15055 ss-10]
MTITSPAEGEMPRSLKSIVTNCWDENQWEQGIRALEDTRSPKARPSPAHIRQLIYMSLQSSSPSVVDRVDVNASPSKIARRERFSIGPPTVISARKLLRSFAHTNTPQGLLTALPSYEFPAADDAEEGSEGMLSLLAQNALQISEASCCWEILKGDFFNKAASSSPRKRTRRSKPKHDEDDEPELVGPVGENAWSLLEWLIILWEKDQLNVDAGEPQHSRLLLNQIKPDRGDKVTRWDFNGATEVVIYAVSQKRPEHRRMGIRLLALLIHLSMTVFLDLQMLLNVLYQRFSSSPDLVTEIMPNLSSEVPSITRFKLAIAQRCLNTDTTGKLRRPAARPRAVGKSRTESKMTVDAAAEGAAGPPTIARKLAPPAMKDVLSIVAANTNTQEHTMHLKFEFLNCFALIQGRLPEDLQDEQWRTAEGKEEFAQVASRVFVNSPDYFEMLMLA